MTITYPLNPWQQMVLGDYAGSMGFNLGDYPEDVTAVIEDDTLIQFILTELDETEDCYDYTEAMRRMDDILDDVHSWTTTLRFVVAVQGDNENDQAT